MKLKKLITTLMCIFIIGITGCDYNHDFKPIDSDETINKDYINVKNNKVNPDILSEEKNRQITNTINTDGIIGSSIIKTLALAPTKNTINTISTKKQTLTKTPTLNDIKKYVNTNNFSSTTKYFILVNTKVNHTYVFKGSKNKWTLVRDMFCTTGKPSTPTIKGNYTIKDKGSYFRVNKGVICKYWTRISGNYLFHTVLLDNKGNVVDGRLGQNLSHGCVRLSVVNAKWIQDNIPRGTKVHID